MFGGAPTIAFSGYRKRQTRTEAFPIHLRVTQATIWGALTAGSTLTITAPPSTAGGIRREYGEFRWSNRPAGCVRKTDISWDIHSPIAFAQPR